MIFSTLGGILMQSFVTVNLVWFHYLQPKFADDPNELAYEYLTRFGTILFVWAMPLTIPDLTLFSKTNSTYYVPFLGICIPSLVHICLKYRRGYGRFYWQLLIDITLMLVAMCIFVMCIRDTMANLVEFYMEEQSDIW